MLNFLRRSGAASLSLSVRVLILSTLLLLVVAVAFVLTLRYRVLPEIERYHGEVTQMASRALGLPVTIGRIEADWHGLRPHLAFTDVRLLDAQGNSVLMLRRVDNVLAWMTLLSGELRLDTLEIDDPDLVIRRDKEGRIYVAGLQISQSSGDDKLSDWLLHQSRIIVRNGHISWQDDLYDRPLLELSQAQLRVENSGHHHRFALKVTPLPTVASPLDVRGDLVGSSFQKISDWHGELFAQIDRVDIEAWGAWLTLPAEFSHAKGGARAWLGVEAGRINRITADLDVGEVRSRLAADLPAVELARLYGRVGAHLLERGFEISSQGLAAQLADGFVLRPTDFYLRLSGQNENRFAAGEVRANLIDLSDFAKIAEYIPVEAALKQKLYDFAPRGHLSDLRVQWKESTDKRARFDIKAHFDNVSMRRVDGFPGVENLSGQVSGSDRSGSLSINSPGLTLDTPQWLLEPLAFDTFAVQAEWQRKRGGWEVKLNNFSAANADVAGTAYGSYQTAAQGPGIADVSLKLTRASVPHVVRYLPKELLGSETMAWLQTGLQAGESQEARLRLRGNLNDFPFPQNQKGIFQVKVKAQGVVIDYAKDWPRVEDAQAELLIEGGRLQIDSTSAKLAGASVKKVSVAIPDLMSAEPVLQIRGEVSGETRHGLDFIKHSPVRTYINGFTDHSTARGEGDLTLALDIPLSDKPVTVRGKYHFAEDDISLDDSFPLLRKASGDLVFTETSLQADNLRAQMLGGPATASILTETGGLLKIKLQGKTNMAEWRKTNSLPALRALSGGAEWSADIAVKDDQVVVQVASSLQGLGSSLPLPLAKRANDIMPLKFELRTAGASQDVMWLQYGNIVSARMLRMDDAKGERNIKRGYVNFGPARKVPDREGMWVGGSVPVLALEGWGEVLSGDAGEQAFPQIDGVDMSVQKVVGYGSAISGLNIHARNRNGNITAQLNSKDVNGEASWFPAGRGKLVARLKNAALDEVKSAEPKRPLLARDTPPNKKAGPVTIPVIDVAIDQFTYHGKPLGRVELHASQTEKEILLDHFRLSSPEGVLAVNGKWDISAAQTHAVVKLQLNDVGGMLAHNGFPNSVKNGSGTLEGDLVWPGGPDDLMLRNLDGQLNLKLAKGQFLQLDPGAGKLLSVLSLQSLPKRITLDFTDVFSKGFEFDSIVGAAQVRKGVLSTNDLKIKGSAAEVSLNGQVDLNRETQTLRVRVSPTIGDSVSLLALAAVSPVVGAGVFLANKILRDPLDKLVSFEYNVTGSWADPLVEKVGKVKASSSNAE